MNPVSIEKKELICYNKKYCISSFLSRKEFDLWVKILKVKNVARVSAKERMVCTQPDLLISKASDPQSIFPHSLKHEIG